MIVPLFAGAVIVLFFGCVQLLSRQKQPLHYCMAVSCIGASYAFMYDWALATGLVERCPALAGTDIAAIFITAPGFYLAALTILHEEARPVRRYAAYYIAPALLALGTTLYGVFAGPSYQKTFGEAPGHFSPLMFFFAGLSAAILLFVATALNLLAARRLHKAGQVTQKAEFRSQVAILFCYLADASLFISSFIFKDEKIYSAALLACCCIMIAYAVTHSAVSYFPARGRSPRPRGASGRPEWDQTSPDLASRLEKLMESATPFQDERLSLPRLAAMVGEAPKRLSYHLHTQLSQSFRGYINEWRLKAVCRDLLQTPDRSILDIAFENGFNSKSSFNTLFFKKYGMTPREYRKERQNRQTPHRSSGRGLLFAGKSREKLLRWLKLSTPGRKQVRVRTRSLAVRTRFQKP
jgi:AraC-like DNA-binding protein